MLDLVDERPCMGDYEELGRVRCAGNQLCECWQQFWVEACFGLVEYEERGWSWAKQCDGEQQEAKRAIGQFGCCKSAVQSVLLLRQFESATYIGDIDAASWKRCGDRFVQALRVADLDDRPPSRGQGCTLVVQHGRAGADGADTCGSSRVGAE